MSQTSIEPARPPDDVRLRHTLEEIIARIRRLLHVDGCAFQIVDWVAGVIRPAASWFADDHIRAALEPILTRPYEPERAGVTEAAIEHGAPLLVPSMAEWPGAGRLRERLSELLGPEAAARTWELYERSSFLSCPVRTADGRTLGVLGIFRANDEKPLDDEDLHTVLVLADLAGLALDGAERAAQVELLNRAAAEVSRSLELDAVYEAIVEQAQRIAGAPKALLARFEPATQQLRVVAHRGFVRDVERARFGLGEGMMGEVARTGEPYIRRPEHASRFLDWTVRQEGIESFVHLPIKLGPRLFGVLNISSQRPGHFDESLLELLTAFTSAAAGAIANALDFQRERRVAHALTRGFVPGPAPTLPGVELGLVYEPAGNEVSGGDVFGAWTLPGGAIAVLVGDVSGKGLEVAALSAMARHFVEARTFDCESPGAVLDQATRLLARHLPSASFVSAVLSIIDGDRLRYSNAGHGPPVALPAAGGEHPLRATGLPLGVDGRERYGEVEIPFGAGDLLFASTDGLAEARRAGAFFGDARLPGLLAEHGRRLHPQALVDRMRREVQDWSPDLQDDIVILAARRKADAPAHR